MTLTPYLACSTRRASDHALSAALVAPYTDKPGNAWLAQWLVHEHPDTRPRLSAPCCADGAPPRTPVLSRNLSLPPCGGHSPPREHGTSIGSCRMPRHPPRTPPPLESLAVTSSKINKTQQNKPSIPHESHVDCSTYLMKIYASQTLTAILLVCVQQPTLVSVPTTISPPAPIPILMAI
ncbi:unnamed protein product [Timema podura]|uniref:Uncharacterized protein n=1 Tax=Timema podura TaxID=61482 RepID=A0ABN7ND04_TIMPD|nr:unnamed protein product [Timema podura]